MLDFNEPVLEDRSRSDAILRKLHYRADDFCFGNLFIWRHKSHTKIAFEDGFLLVRFRTDDGSTLYLYPAGSGDKSDIIRKLAKSAGARGETFILASVTQEMQTELETIYPGKFRYVPMRDYYDYIYRSADLGSLAGRKYHSKRNHIARFKALGDWKYEEISPKNLPECVAMNDEWCRQNGCGKSDGLTSEHCAVREAFRYYDRLGFTGGLLRLNGRVVAFTIGEELCDDTFVVHIEKAFGDVEGAYTAINNEFVLNSCPGYTFVNREEDLGEEGLRKAKLSYHPAVLLEKYRAVLKEGATL